MNERNHNAVIYLKELGFPLQNIRKCMHKLTGITQPEMAELVGCSRQNITHHIDGRRDDPDTRSKIADVWGVPVNDLFENDGDNNHETPDLAA